MACHLRIGPIANLVRRALLALGDISACLFFAYNPLQIQFAYALKQCDSRADAGTRNSRRLSSCFRSTSASRIPQQIKRKEARPQV